MSTKRTSTKPLLLAGLLAVALGLSACGEGGQKGGQQGGAGGGATPPPATQPK